jgi:ribonuclease HII
MIGIDEVGRGCWAGPMLVVAARSVTELPEGLRDSKKLTKLQREKLQSGIKLSCDLGEGWVTAQEIDLLGLTDGTKLGVKRALEAINAQSDEKIIMDGIINYVPTEFTDVQCIAKADDLYRVVSAASIYAKVIRDDYMSQQVHAEFPGYGFDKHVGYGTALHVAAIKLQGICTMHRTSYKPVRLAMEQAND